MKCERVREQMEEWLDGGLDANERSGLERHVGGCPACARYLSDRRAMAAALRKSFRELGSELHFRPRPLSWRPSEAPPARPRPWLIPLPRVLTALAATLVVALLFIFHPWTKPRPGAPPVTSPTPMITIQDSLNITDETFITGCYSGGCYSIDMRISAITINNPS